MKFGIQFTYSNIFFFRILNIYMHLSSLQNQILKQKKLRQRISHLKRLLLDLFTRMSHTIQEHYKSEGVSERRNRTHDLSYT